MNTFCLPVNICFGDDALSILSVFNDTFLVCDSFFKGSPLLKKVTEKLRNYTLFCDFTPDPTLESVSKGLAEFLKGNHKSMIVLGGGSAIDTAKAILYFNDTNEKIPFAAIPTTSGTGSEVTSFSVVTDNSSGRKFPLVSKKMLPDIAILDVEFVKTVPSKIVADTGADVLSHAIESYVAKDSSPFSEALCEKAITLVFKHLKKAVEGDIESKKQMHFASTLAGLAFDQTNLGLCHAMAHNIGAKLKIPHGRTNAILLPHIIKFNVGSISYSDIPTETAEKYAKISVLLGHSGTTQVLVKRLISEILSLFSSIGIPKKFECENAEKLAEEVAECALKDGCINGNPVPVKKEDIIKIYKGVI